MMTTLREGHSVPLLNEYKYGIARRRLLQTATGGLKLRKAPWYVHAFQIGIWAAPLLLYVPFLVLAEVASWNVYYLGLVYASLCWGGDLALGIVGFLIRRKFSPVFSVCASQTDEDSVHFNSFFEAYDFIFASKGLTGAVIHSLVYGLVAFCGSTMLSPALMRESLPVGGIVPAFVLGWFAFCSALYSLMATPPPEPAIYRPNNSHQFTSLLNCLMRPLYIVLVTSTYYAVRQLVSQPALYMQLLYAATCVLPVGWLLGILPPLNALVLWLMEQALVILMGGSPLPTDARLVGMLLVSLATVSVLAVVATKSSLGMLLGSTAMGFVLSQDLFSWTPYRFSYHCFKCLSGNLQATTPVFASYWSFDFRHVDTIQSMLKSVGIAGIKGALLLPLGVVVMYLSYTRTTATVQTVVCACTSVLYVVQFLLESSQSLYVMKIFRNPCHPCSTDNTAKFRRQHKILDIISVPRRLLANLLPLLLVSCIGVFIAPLSVHNTSGTVWFAIMTARITRKVWQATPSAHLDLTIASALSLSLSKDNGWAVLGIHTQVFIVGVALDVARRFWRKLEFVAALLVGFATHRKLRLTLPLHICVFVLFFLFSPLLLATMLISSVISAPLLPLFTLPLFVVAFPRTARFWPSCIQFGGSYSKNPDSVFYEQAIPEMARAISSSMKAGAISAQPGTYVLMRFQDRLSIATVLESGYGYCIAHIRGLELQETSCHTVEANRVDDIFERAYRGSCRSCLNINSLNTLRPVDSAVITTYSDAHNVLSGVIDQPASLDKFSSNLLKTLVWVLFQHRDNFRRYLPLSTVTSVQSQSQAATTSPVRSGAGPGAESSTKKLAGKAASSDTVSWSSSVGSLELEPIPNPQVLNIRSPAKRLPLAPRRNTLSLPGLIAEDRPLDSDSDATPDRAFAGSLQSAPTLVSVRLAGGRAGPASPPGTIPIKHSTLNKLLHRFPHDWLGIVTRSRYGQGQPEMPPAEVDLFVKVVLACFSVADTPTSGSLCGAATVTKPLDVYKGFHGEFPHSEHSERLAADTALMHMVHKAYRYAVKLLYDDASLGEVQDDNEMAKCLESYDDDWFIGSETESKWEEAIRNKKPHLFSLGRDLEKSTYTAHVLTLQEMVMNMGQLNPEALHGIWADLSFELFYLTNDDEERYSIQAHPTVLRNLTIQSADPPLGYSVYSSSILRLPLN